jgi:hypothetical protein
LTFSSFDGAETDVNEFPLDVFVAGKPGRVNRIGFVSFVDVMSKRPVIDGVEEGDWISTTKVKMFLIFFDLIKVIYLIENLV